MTKVYSKDVKGVFGNLPYSENFYSFVLRNKFGIKIRLVNFLFPGTNLFSRIDLE